MHPGWQFEEEKDFLTSSSSPLLFHNKSSLHAPVVDPAKHRTLEGKGTRLVRRELDGGRLVFFELLLDMESVYLDPVIMVCRGDDELDWLALFYADGIRRKLIFLGCHLNL